MTLSRLIAILSVLIWLPLAAAIAQDAETPPTDPRAATGGAQTLEDILARQRGETIDMSFRDTLTGPDADEAAFVQQLGTLGITSDPALWRALRYNDATLSVSSRSPAADVVMQDSGMTWLAWRAGPLRTYGGYLMLGMIAFLAVFLALRGRIRTDHPLSGRKVLRFSAIERFGHWLLAGSFILLGVTGLVQLFGRVAIIPLIGHEAFAPIAIAGKWVHNNVAWAFMLGLIMVTVFWISHNIPNRLDLKWIAVGGGLFSKGVHPPAKKFNAGQKIIFWAVVVLGVSISASGLSLLFPFELPMFAATFEKLNALGIPGWFGMDPLKTELMPHEEMQLAQLWHAIVAFVFMAIILAHIYIGSIGMEGAFDAMGKGEVDETWAAEHHSLWLEELKAKESKDSAASTPAE
ncbi:formate dehydrogenase subunit gamma [Pelagovum sp. HNIBRBA483]|uniref:formate dehydrogenase subunit gamma n=1 Tax=Pelagovum sp. HNIBRBA483 TaxID=3233341 RepID=UPI0034A44735